LVVIYAVPHVDLLAILLRQWRKAPDPQYGAFGSFIKDALSIFDLLGQISFCHPRIFPGRAICYVPYVDFKL